MTITEQEVVEGQTAAVTRNPLGATPTGESLSIAATGRKAGQLVDLHLEPETVRARIKPARADRVLEFAAQLCRLTGNQHAEV
jgi:hypothetical protein